MIKIENLTKIYSRKQGPALDSLSLEIRDGEILGFVGLNGAGKTTTIRISSGVTLPTGGDVYIDGKSVTEEKPETSRNLGWIPEFPNYETNAKPVPLMKYFAGYYGLQGKEAEDTITNLLKEVGLWEYRNMKLRNYSQGMKKRFSLAESLLGDPGNLMFDETLNGLDPEGVQFVRELILSQKQKGKAILLSSHILSEIEAISDRVAIIHRGKLLKVLTREELRNLGLERINIEIDNVDKGAMGILDRYGQVERTDGKILLSSLKIGRDRYPEIVSELVESGYRVRRFEPFGESLEEFFFKTIGEER
jgi:ABC-2 type transport system ATP-binding protein